MERAGGGKRFEGLGKGGDVLRGRKQNVCGDEFMIERVRYLLVNNGAH